MAASADDDIFILISDHRASVMIDAFLRRPVSSLDTVTHRGPGIYGLFYLGPHHLYRSLPASQPIYIGVATVSVAARVSTHTRSITAADNLELRDFRVSYLPLGNSAEAHAAETLAIACLQPLWNSRALSGLGNNAPGSGRAGQRRSRWDTVHPGRVGRATTPARALSTIERDVAAWIEHRRTLRLPRDAGSPPSRLF